MCLAVPKGCIREASQRRAVRRGKNGMCLAVPKGRIGEASQKRVQKREECQNAVLGKCVVGVSSVCVRVSFGEMSRSEFRTEKHRVCLSGPKAALGKPV